MYTDTNPVISISPSVCIVQLHECDDVCDDDEDTDDAADADVTCMCPSIR